MFSSLCCPTGERQSDDTVLHEGPQYACSQRVPPRLALERGRGAHLGQRGRRPDTAVPGDFGSEELSDGWLGGSGSCERDS